MTLCWGVVRSILSAPRAIFSTAPGISDRSPLPNTPVRFRKIAEERIGVALGKTAGCNHLFLRPAPFDVDDGSDRFFFRFFDETAGVDDDDIGIFWGS